MNLQRYIPALIECPDQTPVQHLLFGEALGQPRHSFAFQCHGHEHCRKVAAEQRFEVQVIFLAAQSVGDDASQSGFVGVREVG